TEDDEIRDAAVFGLSQLPRDQAVELLIDVVRTVPDARVRSRALFWLAEFDDPRAIALFEEILSRG
ncbi:MAG TPA: HEAT repeat domain-containing protein, partial [Gemmatimonadota bacterium]|nr:HEAT repeat domain-containing protein [Longimicrobiales bacterium]HUP20495.1 HEAT repeat domain-containing protein [Gemmatimonadota bacterium]